MANGVDAIRGIAAYMEPPRAEAPKPAGTQAERAHKEAGDLLAVFQPIPKARRPMVLEIVRRLMELDEPPVKEGLDEILRLEQEAQAREKVKREATPQKKWRIFQ